MKNIIRIAKTDSTNTLAKKIIKKGVEPGTIIVADYQTSGQGRLGKNWYSSAGKGLYCSVILRPNCHRDVLSLITLLTGLVVAETIEHVDNKVFVKLKWPNDIIINNKKCAGILCEAVLDQPDGDYVIVGIGININLAKEDFPEDLQLKTTSIKIETASEKDLDIQVFLDLLYENLLKKIEEFEVSGFDRFIDDWRKRDHLQKKKATWRTVGRDIVTGTALSLADNGEYFIKDDDGKLHQVLSGDISIVENTTSF